MEKLRILILCKRCYKSQTISFNINEEPFHVKCVQCNNEFLIRPTLINNLKESMELNGHKFDYKVSRF